MFICPTCNAPLQRGNTMAGMFWCCPRCRGRTVSASVLRKAVGSSFVSRLWGRLASGNGAPGRNCPTCRNPMQVVDVPDVSPHLHVDLCRSCQFVWFDTDEFESVPQSPDPEPSFRPSPMPQKAREALAIYEAQRLAETAPGPDPEPDAEWKLLPAYFGFPVESDTHELTRQPIATWTVASVILVISLIAFAHLQSAVDSYGLIPSEFLQRGGITSFTSFFLHGNAWHLIGNLYFLLLVGDNVEEFLGHHRFLLLLLAATLTGDISHFLVDPRSDTPCIGASGGISGVMAFYALKFPKARLSFLWHAGWFHGWVGARWIQMTAWCAFCLWIALQLWGAMEQIFGIGHVSAMGHLGGVLAGVLLWLKWREA